ELQVDLTAGGDTRGSLVNKNEPRCIEIWNFVFIQFNANPEGSFTPLPQRHVDTGMGFERTTAIIQGTKNLTDFSGTVSNYETDIFRPLFDEIENISGKKYASTLPDNNSHQSTLNHQLSVDIAFRVVADHIRALSFAIADGIVPSNEGRGYVLRRILRRAVRYGCSLGFHEPFFFKLVDVVAKTMGDVFPEVREDEIRRNQFPAATAFKLYDTYGFPLDLTELMARERGLTVDVAGFEKLMEQQRERTRKAQKKEEIAVAGEIDATPTKFLGYDFLETEAVVETVLPAQKPEAPAVVLDRSPCYAALGWQVGDHGLLHVPGHDPTDVGQLRVIET